MIKRIQSMVLVLAGLLGTLQANAEFRDIRLDLTNGNYLTAEEANEETKPSVSVGFAVAADGTVSRVETSDASAAIVATGNFHSKQHGWSNFSSTVAVDGPVRITFGGCAWGGNVTVKDADGQTVATFTSKTSDCWNSKTPDANVASELYKGGATTLTIAGGSYVPYIAVEAVDPAELVDDATISFAFGDYADAGQLPAAEKVEIGKTFTIPANYTLYQEGQTLVGWTDGSKNYEIGEIITVSGDLELTPRFVANTVSLADRKEEVTLRWNFRRDQGCPAVAWEGRDGFLVTQVKIGTETIDVKLPIATSPGKFNNGSNTDWAQVNNGTTFTLPSCKGAVVSYESYNASETTTVDGQTIETSKTPSFTVAGDAETVDLVANDVSYMRFVQVALPLTKATGGNVFDNVEGTITWTVGNEAAPTYSTSIDGAVSTASVATGSNLTIASVTYFDRDMVRYQPGTKNAGNVSGVMIEYSIKAAKGLTFTPKSVSYNAVKVGTDGATFSYSYVLNGKESSITDVDAKTVLRNNGANASSAQLGHSVSINGSEVNDFAFRFYISKTAADKQIALSDIVITGVFNGTTEEVEKFEIGLATSLEGAGSVNAYPTGGYYDKGTEIKVSTVKNFGYKFLNWTDSEGNVVSKDAEFTYTVEKATTLTANYQTVNTYELKYGCADGVKPYMLVLTPAPTDIDGKHMYEAGTKVSIEALENDAYTFTNWDNGQGLNPFTIVMNSDQEITANFAASDFIAGWDFYTEGGSSRPADFFAAENDAVSLVLRNEAGDISGWLDKSQLAAGGYEGAPAAVNWRTTGLGEYYWETTVNAEAFSDIKVKGQMLYNYNAYTTYNIEASINGTDWTPVGSVTIDGRKSWTKYNVTLPAQFNNQPALSIRWIADKSSTIDGTTSNNDGIAFGATTIFGTPKLVDDGTAPELVSVSPEEGSNTATINGKIVLTFDEKVKVKSGTTATLGDLSLEPSVTGKAVSFAYRNLDYATDYTFTLPASTVSDLTDNAYDKAITINFTTKTRPAVEKAEGYDFIVPDDGTFKEAIAAANNRADKSIRFVIFVKKGLYELPWSETETITKDGTDNKGNEVKATLPSPITRLYAANTSIIGEDRDATVIKNLMKDATASGTSYPIEGLHNVTTLSIEKGADNTYIQDITLKNGMNDNTGRGEALGDYANHTILKNVTLWGYQDTYCGNSDNGVYYFEGGIMRGRTDFLCGKGDIFFKGVTLQMCQDGGYIAVPMRGPQFGYVFKDCEIVAEKDGIDGKFTLGRPWGSGTPVAVFIDTKMTVQPKAEGWAEMSGGYPKRFAEYNSFTASGTQISLSKRKTTFGDNQPNNPILTKAEAEAYSYDNFSAFHNWDPATIAEQAPVPAEVTLTNDGFLTWDDCDYARFWAVFKDGVLLATVKEPILSVEAGTARAAEPVYTVRAANEMGGLGEAVTAVKKDISSSLTDAIADAEVVSTVYYNIQGIAVSPNTTGLLIKVETLATGATRTSKVIVK